MMDKPEKSMLDTLVSEGWMLGLKHSIWFYIPSKADLQGGVPACIIEFLRTLQHHGIILEGH